MAHGWSDYSPSRDSAWETQLTGILQSPAVAPSDTLKSCPVPGLLQAVTGFCGELELGPLLPNTSVLSSSLQYHWLVPYQPGLDILGTPVLNEALIQIPLLCE